MVCGERTQQIKVELASTSRNIKVLTQSPDLSSTEGYWNIIEQEMRRRLFPSEKDVKAAVQDEWRRLTKMEEPDRIKNMPGRYKRVKDNGGEATKTAKR